eukprot:scaffold66508_cov69-Phaeocystis_antarctica.AAC.1
MLSKASRNGLGHLVLPLGFHTTSMITGIPTIVIASCTLVSAFMLSSQASRGGRRCPRGRGKLGNQDGYADRQNALPLTRHYM